MKTLLVDWTIRIQLLAFALLIAHAANAQTQSETPDLAPLPSAIMLELQARIATIKGTSSRNRLRDILRAYEENSYESLWIENGAATNRARSIVESIGRAPEHALHPEDYAFSRLNAMPQSGSYKNLAAYEVQLSASLVAYAQHLNAGRLNPRSINRENVIYPEAISAARVLQQAKSTISIAAYLRLLAPRTPRYERLRIAFEGYRALGSRGGWDAIPEGEVLKPGMEDARVPALRKRLATSGDYIGNIENPSTAYEGDIVDAVMYFQKRHGLEIDGVIGPNTLREINVPIEERIAMMEYNLERRRWMQNDYGNFYVFANLADQVLKVVDNEKTIHAELIQVGLPYHRTPVFTDEMEYIEINPYWNVPRSIAINELLPKLRRNASALNSQNFEVLAGGNVVSTHAVAWNNYSKGHFPVRLRQKPGKGNALGRIKFMFPNSFSVYIHDTPSKSKFDRASRFFSHGCLRLRDPLKMAEVILGRQGWSRQKIDAVVASRKRTVVRLEQKIPVHIAYMTAWVNKDGSIHFRRDVYGRDKIVANALAKLRS